MDDRTMIAAMAMQGILAGKASNQEMWGIEDSQTTAAQAVERADDLLAELAKTAPAPAKAGPSPAFKAMREALECAIVENRTLILRSSRSLPETVLQLMHDAVLLADKEHPRA